MINDDLDIWFIEADPLVDTPDLVLLEQAMDEKIIVVHEKENVNELLVENISEDKTVFIQAGEMVKGGKQDRAIQIDLVLPAKSGRVPLPAFCVEAARWRRRGPESMARFSSSKSMVSGKELRGAVRKKTGQGEVWNKVHETQEKMSTKTGSPIYAKASPSSYLLSMEHEAMVEARQKIQPEVEKALAKHPKALGFAFAINGKVEGSECYPNRDLLEKSWSKWAKVMAEEAIMEARDKAREEKAEDDTKPELSQEAVDSWVREQMESPVVEDQQVPPVTRLIVREKGGTAALHTLWKKDSEETPLHESILPA
jgi:hypothetical protein